MKPHDLKPDERCCVANGCKACVTIGNAARDQAKKLAQLDATKPDIPARPRISSSDTSEVGRNE